VHGARRYGPSNGPIKLTEYHQSRNELEGAPGHLGGEDPGHQHAEHLLPQGVRLRQEPGTGPALHQGDEGRRRRRRRARGCGRRGEVDHRQVRPGEQRRQRRAYLHLTHRDPHRRRHRRDGDHDGLGRHVRRGRAHVGRPPGGAHKAAELGLYGPGQDLVADAFTGNLRGAGPATVALPLPVRKDNPSQTVLVSFADKTEPMAFNYYATGAYLLPRFNTGLVIASSKNEARLHHGDRGPRHQGAGDRGGRPPARPEGARRQDGGARERAPGKSAHAAGARGPLRHRGAHARVALRHRAIWSRNDTGERDQLGYVCSAERLHNIKTKKGFTYGGKDDQCSSPSRRATGRRPARSPRPGRRARWSPATAGGATTSTSCRCRSTRRTSYWSGPILSAITLSINIHTGRIGAISDQFALGTPWDAVRRQASELAIQFRLAHGIKQPATLHEDELEYQEGWRERRARLERQFELKPPLTFGGQRPRRERWAWREARRRAQGWPSRRDRLTGERRRSPDAPHRSPVTARRVNGCAGTSRRSNGADSDTRRVTIGERRPAPPDAPHRSPVTARRVNRFAPAQAGARTALTRTRDGSPSGNAAPLPPTAPTGHPSRPDA